MQHQNQQNTQKNEAAANGSTDEAEGGRVNGANSSCEDRLSQNGVICDENNQIVKLSNVNQEMVRLIGQHLMNLGLK